MEETHEQKSLKRRFHPLPVNVPLSKGVLLVDDRRCTGCMNCMYACTLYNDGVAAPEIARIQLNAYSHHIFDIAAQPCLQCVQPQCLRFCPQGAIRIDEESGTNARIIVEKKCIGCQECIEVCPFTPPRIRFDSVKKKAIKCNLCGGDPQCVKACPIGALIYYTNPEGVISGYGAGGI
ncbi:MAG: 4Fe-4S dicluster domain-containing protein [Proteobacteria bacterium]|nr:4Fe-4S dicluster domain-containing protein [Pseudomonadota bacterium]